MRREAEELVQRYFDENIEAPDTKELLRKLNPVIVHKCTSIKEKKKSHLETAVFVFGCILALLVGTVLLFPDLIDYGNEIIQFVLPASAGGLLLIAINLTIRGLANNMENQSLKLRERLL